MELIDRRKLMLILTRRIGESIIIGDDIKITILEIRGQQVWIGIEAPSGVSVHREEIYHRIHGDGDFQKDNDSE